jgi:hypothetical protein
VIIASSGYGNQSFSDAHSSTKNLIKFAWIA